MPRRRTLTGRVNRANDRQRKRRRQEQQNDNNTAGTTAQQNRSRSIQIIPNSINQNNNQSNHLNTINQTNDINQNDNHDNRDILINNNNRGNTNTSTRYPIRSRSRSNTNDNQNPNANNNVNLNLVILEENFKSALNIVPENYESFHIGSMNIICRYCNSKNFSSEITAKDRDKFTNCCHKGKVSLRPLSQNNFFNSFYDTYNTANSKNYFDNIRSYNAAFAMVSCRIKIDRPITNGVYHFKIHDAFYHQQGATQAPYGANPTYAQCYFYDTETAVNYRMANNQRDSKKCLRSIMLSIANELNQVNPFVKSFKTMHEICRADNTRELTMIIKADRDLDLRRFNDATSTDVAVIFSTPNGEPPFERNMIKFSKNQRGLNIVSTLDPSLDPLAYPLLFPNGDLGWQMNVLHEQVNRSNSTNQRENARNKITMLQYVSYRLAIRSEFSLLHHSQKLFLQWVVDNYVRIEGSRLHFVRNNQKDLRSEVYYNLSDYFNSNHDLPATTMGRAVILPSSFIGSPRNMYQNYLDAMAIVQTFGKPSLFVTMTCNPNWDEIKSNLGHETSNFRPDIVVRVFKSKLQKLIDLILKKNIFGKVIALIYTIEFQKRGLPHAHILITLSEEDKIVSVNDINRVVCAELPNSTTHPKLYDYVKTHMIHGPCGILNQTAVCMQDGKCTKDFPKNFCEQTQESINGYPMYQRRNNGAVADVRGHTIDNRYVVPYNPYLLAKFNCHLNVEVCTTVKSVKYIYKYVYKGYDSARVQLRDNQQTNQSQQQRTNQPQDQGTNQPLHIDEVDTFVTGRYVGSTEAAWRIFEYKMHFQTHTIVRLDIHLKDHQNVVFREGNEIQALRTVRKTKLLAFFNLNRVDNEANELLYCDVPKNYIWDNKSKTWKKRTQRGDNAISRLYVVSPKNIELFHMRILLLHVKGPKSFEDLRTYNNVVYNTYVEACHARGIASNDNEWRNCLLESRDFHSPKQMRDLFAFILALNTPNNAMALWEEFKDDLSEDFARTLNIDVAYNRALLEIEEVLVVHNLNCLAFNLPVPTILTDNDLNEVDVFDEQFIFEQMYDDANNEQKHVIDQVLREVQFKDTGSNVFCLSAHAGCGKTFVQTAIIHRMNALNLRCIATAYSGIASTLLINGRTLHNVFKLPIPILDNSTANVRPNSSHGRYINAASLVIIDEYSMCPKIALKIIDKLLKDLASNENKSKLFGGKTILLCGDLRQILPVVPHASRSVLIENCVISWEEYHKFHKIRLNQNMRALPEEVDFVNFLKKMGDGRLVTYDLFGEDIIELPQHSIGDMNHIIEDIYGDVRQTILSDEVLKRAILAPTNEDCYLLNSDILNRMDGQEKCYYSYDKIVENEGVRVNDFPIEFLNSLTVSGMPPHKLNLKENCIVMLIRNLNTAQCLVNGTRLRVKCMHQNTLDCEVLTGTALKKRILIPRINLTFSGTTLPFQFQRTQFPIIPAFAMTINKSQGQTFNKIGIMLRRPVFSHGQLYVACSRVRSFNGLKFYVNEGNGQGKLYNDERIFTKNIVYREILNIH